MSAKPGGLTVVRPVPRRVDRGAAALADGETQGLTGSQGAEQAVEIVVSLIFLWLMITVVLPWAAQNFANSARERFIATPVASR